MEYDKAIEIIDNIFATAAENVDGIEVCFIGGEPLLEYELIIRVVEHYNRSENKPSKQYIFSATTNGVLLNAEMKEWFQNNKDKIILCLSLDGAKETQNHNRPNSFDKIDFDFFVRNYSKQGVKMTLSDYSLPRLSENVFFIHSLGFKK